jgi:hypothetical protein
MTLRLFASAHGVAALLATALPAAMFAAASPVVTESTWSFTSAVSLRASYDSNVYMQDVTARADRGSFISSLLPVGSVVWKPSRAFTLAGNYSPEFSLYSNASSENTAHHKVALTLSGQRAETKWELGNNVSLVNGDHVGPTFTGQGGSAILAGVPLLERRDQRVLRQNFKLQLPVGSWFVRPVASSYVHDFRTDRRTTPGYQNYIDRDEFAAGFDAGKKLPGSLTLFAGFRYGAQHQSASPVSAFQYDNRFRRVLVGAEASPRAWLKFSLLAGPDQRSFASSVPATLDRNHTRLFLDANTTVTIAKTDTAAFSAKRFALPGYGGGSFLEITALDLSWKHTFNSALSATVTGRNHRWNFALPVVRDESWRGVGLTMTAKWNARVSFAAAVAHDAIRSKVPNTSGREATRTLVSLSVNSTF